MDHTFIRNQAPKAPGKAAFNFFDPPLPCLPGGKSLYLDPVGIRDSQNVPTTTKKTEARYKTIMVFFVPCVLLVEDLILGSLGKFLSIADEKAWKTGRHRFLDFYVRRIV